MSKLTYKKLAETVVGQFQHPVHIALIADAIETAMEREVPVDFRIQVIMDPPNGVTITRKGLDEALSGSR